MDYMINFLLTYLIVGYFMVASIYADDIKSYNELFLVFLGWPYYIIRDFINLIKKIEENTLKNINKNN